jgi:hypothetical protein
MKKNNNSTKLQSNSKQARVKIDLANLLVDSCLRKKNLNYHPSDRDQIQRAYIQKRPVNLVNQLTIEKDILKTMSNENIIEGFQSMRTCQG